MHVLNRLVCCPKPWHLCNGIGLLIYIDTLRTVFLILSESLNLFDDLCVDGTATALRKEILEESSSLARISKSTVGTCSVHFADELQNDDDVGSTQSSSEDSEIDDVDILPALPPTEPGILRYYGEQDVALRLPKVVTNAPVVTIGLEGDVFCEFCGSELMQSSSSDSDVSSAENSGEEVSQLISRDRESLGFIPWSDYYMYCSDVHFNS